MKTPKINHQTKAMWGKPIDTSIPMGKKELNNLFFEIGKDLTAKTNGVFEGVNLNIKWTNYQHDTENPDESLGQFRIILTREKPQS